MADVAVSASIKPLQMIASAITGDHATVSVLANDVQSAHQFSLTPSDRINLQNADIVLWIGPQFEIQLAQFLPRYGDTKALIAATSLPDAVLYELSSSITDPHIWLSLDNAELIAATLLNELVRIDAGNENFYRANFANFAQDVSQLREQVSRDFEFVRNREVPAFAVYHNAFQYFEALAGIKHSFSLVHDPEREPSIRELLAIQEQLSGIKPRCLFAEPDANAALLESVLNNSNVQIVFLDLLGQQLRDLNYFALISGLSSAMSSCLNPQSG
ncbi:MAG: zinc ABC transporter substrate-binding protein [Gammaproteobacteria bacterium]